MISLTLIPSMSKWSLADPNSTVSTGWVDDLGAAVRACLQTFCRR